MAGTDLYPLTVLYDNVSLMTLPPCNHQVITLDMGLLVAGTKYRGEFEERLKKLMEEIKQNDDIILVRFFPQYPCH